MMPVTIKSVIENALTCEGNTVEIAGWVRTIRMSKSLGFIEMNDGTCLKSVQVIIDESLDNYDEVSKLTVGSCLVISGLIVLTPNAKQPFEIKSIKIVIQGKADGTYPLQKKRHGYEFLRTMPHLRARTNTYSAIFRVRSILTHAINLYLNDRGFVYIATPCITTSDCEGAGEAFHITTIDLNNVPKSESGNIDYTKDFFGKETFMTVSGQLNVEPFCMAFRNVYSFGPCFRAENSNTTRHLAEFWQVEPEMAFANLADTIYIIEDMVKYIISYVLENASDEMLFFDEYIEKGIIDKLKNTVNSEFACISYSEAIDILIESKRKFEIPVKWGEGIHTEYERYLADVVFEKPVFVTDYPKEVKAFYMRLNDDDKTVAATDLLFPGIGEIVGASQREERYEILIERIKEMNLDPDDYNWYTELRKYGTCIHSGFGMGIERIMRYITGMDNVRDVISYPRTPKNAEF